MWTIAQNLPLTEASEIAKQLDNFQSLFVIVILVIFIIVLLIGFIFKNQNDTNKALMDNSAAIRDMGKAIKDNTDKNTEIVKIVLQNDKEGDRFMNERLILLEQDYRIIAKTTNEFMAIIKSVYKEKDDTIGKRMKSFDPEEIKKELDTTKPIQDEMLNKLI